MQACPAEEVDFKRFDIRPKGHPSLGRVMNSAGGKIRHQPRFEIEADFRPIGRGAQDGSPCRFHRSNLRSADGHHEIKVMNHHIEHDADIETSEWESAEARGLDVFRLRGERVHGRPGRIESFDMAHHEEGTMFARHANHVAAFVTGEREWLFNEGSDAPLQKEARHGVMGERRNGDANGIDLSNEIRRRMKRFGLTCFGHMLGRFRMGIDHADELDIGEAGQIPCMMPTMMADTDHSHTNRTHAARRPSRPRPLAPVRVCSMNSSSSLVSFEGGTVA